MNVAPRKREDQLHADLASLRIDRESRTGGRGPPRVLRWLASLVLAAGVGAGAWLHASGRVELPLPERSVAVRVVHAARGASNGDAPLPPLAGAGYVVTGDRYVLVGVRVPGRIEKYFVEEGQAVRAGEPLVELDDRDYRATVKKARAQLDLERASLALARAELRRGQTLGAQDVISERQLDVLATEAEVAEARVAQISAELERARVDLEYTLLRAPTDGVVLAKLKEVGEVAVPGGFAGSGDLVRMANLSDLRAEVDVNEADLDRVRLGGGAVVTPDAYPDLRLDAEVVKLYPQVDRQKGTLKVEVRIPEPDPRLLPDMSVRVTFDEPERAETREPEPVWIPASSLREDAAGTFVWIVVDGRARRTAVQMSERSGGRVGIAHGLSGGEAVIVGDAPRDGQRVAVAAPKQASYAGATRMDVPAVPAGT